MSHRIRRFSLALACAALAALVAVPAFAQIRMSQPKPTGIGPGSGVDPDSGAGGPPPPADATPPPREAAAPVAETMPGEGKVSTGELGDQAGEGDEDLPRGGYDPEGRRDPFRPLTGEATDTDQRKKYEGTLQGRLLSEVKLTSIVRTARGNIATFEGGPRKEGYFARVGDKFWDGVVTEINYDTKTVVVRQQLNDPRLIKPYRDQVISLLGDEESQKRDSAGAGN